MVAEGYKNTEIGVIPIEWDVVKLGSLGTTYNGLSGKTKEDFGSGSPYITYMNVFSNNNINTNVVEYVNINSTEKQNKVQNGDIFFTVSSETKDEVGMTSVLLEDFEKDTYINSFCFGFRLNNNEKLLPRFAKFLLREHNTRKRITFYGAGTTRINISKVKLMDLLLQLPPLKEQEKIADILSTADAKIDAIQIQIDRAETLKKGLLQKLLSEGIGHSKFKESEIGKIPESWDITTVGKSSKNFDGQRVPLKSEDRQDIQGDYPYYGAQGIIDYVNDYIFDGEYLLVAEDGENVKGQKYDIAFVVSGKFWVNNHAHILQANDNMDLYFISSILNHINIIKYVTGTGQPKLNKAQLNSIKIPLPPLREQKQIAEILSTADEKLEVLRAKKEKYETLKNGLLQILLTGKIRIKL